METTSLLQLGEVANGKMIFLPVKDEFPGQIKCILNIFYDNKIAPLVNDFRNSLLFSSLPSREVGLNS